MVTPEGIIFNRESILQYLLSQKLELQAKAKKFNEQEMKKTAKETSAKQVVDNKEVEDFLKAEQQILSRDYSHKRALDRTENDDVSRAKARTSLVAETDRAGQEEDKLRKGEMYMKDKAKLTAKCFWTNEATPNTAPAQLKEVDTTTKCPTTGKKLRVKDLISFKFDIYDEALYKAGGGKGVFCCAISKHPIAHQQAVLIKPSGIVVLESVLKDCVFKEMKCPITGNEIKDKKKDILKLQMGGTGFSAHNDTQAKHFNMMKSFGMDSASLQGHLPKAGYVGLR